MRIAIPVTHDDHIGRAFGKAQRMGIADVSDGVVRDWKVYEVAWDDAHDRASEGSHHATIVRFMKDNQVERVIFSHMGDPMITTLTKLGLTLMQADKGNARELCRAASKFEG